MSAQAPTKPPVDRAGEEPPAPPSGGSSPPDPAAERSEASGRLPRTEVVLVCVAAALAAGAAGWMVGGVFDAGLARVVGPAAAVLGAAIVAVSYGLGRPALIQYLAAPLALVAGAALAVADPTAGGIELAELVRDALFSGGLAQPPVPFGPGWQFLLVAVVVLLAAASGAVALGFDRPKLAVLLPVPLVVGAALVQPPEAEVVSTVVAFVLLVAALSVAYGVDLNRSGVSSGRFELRRLLRGAVTLAVLAGGLVALASVASFLLPEPRTDQVVPPQRPEPAPPMEDRELFTVEAERALPWRLGVLDVYEDEVWKLPPHDPDRLVEVPPDGGLPGVEPPSGDTVTAAFELADLPGRALPTLAVPHHLEIGDAPTVHLDPRTQTLRMEQRLPQGLRYTVTAAPPPTSDELGEAPPPDSEMAPFLEAPPAPPEVTALIADAPRDSLFAQLQYVRQALYEEVVAAGEGEPVEVPPARVVEMLDGDQASPFEINAAEALLARWVGVPARVGYGYFGGERADASEPFSVRPARGSTWLEVHFDGYGWIPLVGTPERARGSLSDAHQREDPAVRPTDELALVTYVPVRLEGLTLAFEVARYYALVAVPVVAVLALLVTFYPAVLRLVRGVRRRRWGDRGGPSARIAVAYAELRDLAWDLNVGHPTRTPLEFLGDVAPDDEHRELAWLVTRALWGDLRRDLCEEDVETAESMARSVARRLRGGQPSSARLLAAASRASLRTPYSDELPNLWPRRRDRRGRGRRRASSWRDRLRPPRLRRLLPRLSPSVLRSSLLVVILALLVGCAEGPDTTLIGERSHLPDPAVPDRIGELVLERERSAEEPFAAAGTASLVDHGEVYVVRRDDTVEASLQLGQFKPGLRGFEDDVRDGVLQSLGAGRFEPTRVRDEAVYALETADQRLYLWFAPDGSHYQLLVARRAFEEAGDVLGAVLAFQRGQTEVELTDDAPVRLDPRRGIP